MKNRVRLALMSSLISVAAHLYLALHYYPLKVGVAASESLCNLNAKFDCDAVSASAFSAVFGIPLAIWGAVANAVLFGLIAMSWLEWSEHPERLRRWSLVLAGFTALASVVMGGISLAFMHQFCIVCIGLYVLSFVTFFAYQGFLREPFWANVKSDIPHLWSESRGVTISLLVIPFLAFLLHKIFMENLGISQIGRVVEESISDWQLAKKNDFVAKPTLARGPSPDTAALTLVEFADFRCGHCKKASHSLHAFVAAHPDVRLEFYSFPLDGACNEKIKETSGISCRLAATVYCSEKNGKGWESHDALFRIQDEVNQLGNVAEVDLLLSKELSKIGINWETMQSCLNDPATADAIKAQAKQGSLVNVMGTPTLFANGRLISRVLVPVLQEARKRSLSSNKTL